MLSSVFLYSCAEALCALPQNATMTSATPSAAGSTIFNNIFLTFSLIFASLHAEHVVTYRNDERARPNKRVVCFGRIEIVDAAVAWIPAVHGVARRAQRLIVRREVDLSVGNNRERTILIDNARYCIGKARIFDAVENNCAYGDHAAVRFAARLAVYEPCKQIRVAAVG
ncbi:hypothetical protein SDC9_194439 [bioreactor metagenome]|uniref:Uncharacterized protein n=1 Tax=bioreactor metagenome TaxID=1076179 RepID=A0A645I6W4_9ZZZZ